MEIELNNVIPSYMDPEEVLGSEIYLNTGFKLNSPNKYLIRARSGRGKTSLFSILYGTLTNFDGNLKTSNESDSISTWKNRIACVFQDLKLFPELTALENVLIKNQLTEHKSKKEIESFFEQLGISSKKSSPVAELSQGQKQRVAIIRSLCQPFEFLLLDEPFSHLDDSNIKNACDLINQELVDQNGGLILMSLEDNSLFSFDKKINL